MQQSERVEQQATVEFQQTECLHCGLPSFNRFCCAGCESIYGTLRDLNMLDFYKWRDAGPLTGRQKQPSKTPQSAIDLFREISAREENGHAYYIFEIEGIHCAGCLWLLEKLPRLLVGVERSSLNVTTAELAVTYDPTAVTLRDIAAFLAKLGYSPRTTSSHHSATKGSFIELLRIGVTGFASMNTMMLAVSLFEGFYSGIEPEIARIFRVVSLVLTIPVVFWAAIPLYAQALRALTIGRIHIELPLTLAILSAFVISAANVLLDREYVYFDSICLLVFLLLVSRGLQRQATESARRSARLGWSLLPASARVLVHSQVVERPLLELTNDDIVLVGAGERFPADGEVIHGTSCVDSSILTGESKPNEISCGDLVNAGTLNVAAEIRIRVVSLGENTRIGRLLSELRHRDIDKGSITAFTDKVGTWYLFAIGIALVVTILVNFRDLPHCLESALTLLAVTCPCALAFTVPTMYGLMLGECARRGILVKSTAVLEDLPRVSSLFLDKTGTLTHGDFILIAQQWDEPQTIHSKGILESIVSLVPSHPISKALSDSLRLERSDPTGCLWYQGRGVEHSEGNHVWRLGSPNWAENSSTALTHSTYTEVSLTRDFKRVARLTFGDTMRDTTAPALGWFRAVGIRIQVLSGDSDSATKSICAELGLPVASCTGSLSPEEKSEVLRASSGSSMYVGDGVNDIRALESATIGVAIAGGLSATVEAADIVITKGSLNKVVSLMRAAVRIRRVVICSLFLSLIYNISAAVVTIIGAMNPLVAAFLMPTSSALVMILAMCYRPFKRGEI